MNHIPYENWLHYVKDELDEQTREHYENHLYTCDMCMELYLEAIESYEQQMPVISDEWVFTDSIMQKIEAQDCKETKNSPSPVKTIRASQKKKQTMVNYMLAAAMTILLMSTGVFSQLMGAINTFEKTSTEEHPSFVAQIMNKSISITNKIENSVQEGNDND